MKKILYILTLAGFAFSCTNKEADDLFGKTPIERIRENADELKKELISSPYGWKLVYQTKDDTYGGFTFVMKFNEQGRVVMVSDFDETTTTEQESQYEIKWGQGTLLSFVTKNHIHNLSDAMLGVRGKGYEGEFEFIYLGKENGKIKFKTQRNEKEVYFEKATADDWNLPPDLIQGLKPFDRNSFYYFGRITDATGEVKTYKLAFSLRYLTLSGITNTSEQYKFGVIPTSATHITLSPAPTIEGKTFTELVLEENANPARYTATIDGVTLDIVLSNTLQPEFITDDYLDIENLSQFIFLTQRLKETPVTSLSFKEDVLKIDDSADLVRFDIQFVHSNSMAYIYVSHNFGAGSKYLGISIPYRLENKKIYFTGNYEMITNDGATWTNVNNQAIYDQTINLLRFFLQAGANGFYVEKRSEKYYYTNVVYVLHSESPSGYYFPLYSR